MTPNKMLVEAKRIQAECVRKLRADNTIYSKNAANLIEEATIEINSRYRTAAGRYFPLTNTVCLSSSVFGNKENEHGFFNTVTHELAHAVHANHKREWKKLHIRLGGNGSRLHDLNVQHNNNKNDRKPFLCPSCKQTVWFGPRQWMKFINGWSYRHNTCGARLVYSGLGTTTTEHY